ncbi:MAG: hypothetical protein ACO1NX_02190, partial [Chitinophagaceae bacterium]
LLLLCFSTAAQAQYFVKSPSYDKRENTSLNIEAIRFFTDSLVIDFSFTGSADASSSKYKINPGTEIQLRNLDGFDNIRVSKAVNAEFYDYTYVKKNKTENFSVIFPFSFYKLLVNGNVDENVYEVFTAEAPFNLNFIECSTDYRKRQKLAFGSCFNFSNIRINMPAENWTTLFCSGYLNALLTKDEFETTAKYKSRTSPDSLRHKLTVQIDALYSLFSSNYQLEMNNKRKTLSYNADREEFSIDYEGAEKAVVFLPLAQAPDFKKEVENNDLTLTDVQLVRLNNGSYHIEKMVYENKTKKKKVELENKVKLKNNPKKEFHDKVMADLKRYYTAYRSL